MAENSAKDVHYPRSTVEFLSVNGTQSVCILTHHGHLNTQPDPIVITREDFDRLVASLPPKQ